MPFGQEPSIVHLRGHDARTLQGGAPLPMAATLRLDHGALAPNISRLLPGRPEG